MSEIQNASVSWAGHTFQEVENYIKQANGLYGATAVDLGLPSGTLWADRNVGAALPSDPGLYFTWGSVEGFTKDSGRYCDGSRNGERDWTGPYSMEHGSELGDSQNIPADPYFDAARKNMGAPWRLPTRAEMDELANTRFTRWTWTTNSITGVPGYTVASKNFLGASIFLPAAGFFNGEYSGNNNYGYYWESTNDGETDGKALYFTSTYITSNDGNSRYCGFPVRAVLSLEFVPGPDGPVGPEEPGGPAFEL